MSVVPGPVQVAPARQVFSAFTSIAAAHFLVDCIGGVFPMYKFLVGLDLVKAGFISTVTLLLGAALQPVFGVLADHGQQRRLVILGTALVGASLLLAPVSLLHQDGHVNAATMYSLVFVLLLVVRLGQAAYHPAATSLVGAGAGRRHATWISLFIAVGMIGFSLSQRVYHAIFSATDGATHWALIPLGLMVLALMLCCRPAHAAQRRRVDLRALTQAMALIRGRLLALFIIQASASAVSVGFMFLLPEFLEFRHYPASMIAGDGAALWVFGSVLVMIPGGYLADRFGRRRVVLAMLILAMTLYAVVVLSPKMHPVLYGLLLLGAGGFLGAINPLGVSLGQHLAPGHPSVVSGVLMGLAWAVGSFSPWMVGYLATIPGVGYPGALASLTLIFLPAIVAAGWLLRRRA